MNTTFVSQRLPSKPSSALAGLRLILQGLLLICCLFSAQALAGQASSCCQILRDKGREAFEKKNFDQAIELWTRAKGCSDAPAKCTDLDALINKAKKDKRAAQDAENYIRQQQDIENKRLARERAAEDAWEITRLAKSKDAYEKFINKYPESRHVLDARSRIADIEKADRDKAAALNPSPGTEKPSTKPPPSTLPPAIQKLETDMVSVTGGTFTMGWQSGRDGDGYDDEKPAHQVSVRNFSIGRYEVTQAQWRAVMDSDPPELYNKGCDQCPVERVSWNDIQDFLKKLNSLTDKQYRLPTEAEWEYAARGGAQSRGYLYSGGNDLDAVAWFDGNAKSGNTNGAQKTTRPVGGKKANELGLYDMSGNVYEWCEDDWHGNYVAAPTDGRAWVDSPRGDNRVDRGGGWNGGAWGCRVSGRNNLAPDGRGSNLGFRLAASPSR